MAPIKAEAACIGWAEEHCSRYQKGLDKTISVITDNYPLVAVFGKCNFNLFSSFGMFGLFLLVNVWRSGGFLGSSGRLWAQPGLAGDV